MSQWNKRKRRRKRCLISNKQVRPTRRSSHGNSRRGVLLLVVLSMLTLFLMIGTAYIVTANQYRRTNKILAKATQSAHTPAKQQLLLNEVLGQLLRDTNNRYSNLRYHSLLRDVYGNDGFLGRINRCTLDTNDTNVTNGQILEIRFSTTATNNIQDYFGNAFSTTDLKDQVNAYNGLVLTFLDGPAIGQSTRIVGYYEDTSNTEKVFRVLSFNLANGQPATSTAVLTSLSASRISINGRPYNGTGVGYSVIAPSGMAKLVAGETLYHKTRPTYLPIALMPSPIFTDPKNIDPTAYINNITINERTQQDIWENDLNQIQQNTIENLHYVGIGGSDESYDAIDYQNMFLGMLPLNPGESADPDDNALVNRGIDEVLGTSDDRQIVLPSFHRPALLHYWGQHAEFNPTPGKLSETRLHDSVRANMLRKILLRPNWHDHPNFTGSNPEFAQIGRTDTLSKLEQMIYGPWDVDNDKDGIRDSIWVDFGAPVMEGPHGKLVKPLAALLVLDLDGRLNVNAHGSSELVRAIPELQPLANNTNTTQLPRGEGYGPADIDLGAVLNDPVINLPLENRSMSIGDNPTFSIQRLFDNSSTFPDYWRYGRTNKPGSGLTSQVDLLARIKTQGLPGNARGYLGDNNNVLGEYATPPNFAARYTVGLNDLGQPIFDSYNLQNNTVDSLLPGEYFGKTSPYQSKLSLDASRGANLAAADGLYTVAELEHLLRAYDTDAGVLPPRLWDLANGFMAPKPNDMDEFEFDSTEFHQWRTLLTTDSYDMPVPSSLFPEWVKYGPDGQANTTDDYEEVMGRSPVQGAFADLLEYRIRLEYGPSISDSILRREMTKLMPRELADGLRLDLNRPFGNGRDDNNNGVVDEPGEIEEEFGEDERRSTEASLWRADPESRLPIGFTSPTTGVYRDDVDRNGNGMIEPWERGDTDGDGEISFNERIELHNYRRQALAKDLYVLAMALIDPPAASMTDIDKEKRARRLAQWAINIVDFRDADNCMTPFEFDVEPFDGWIPDGNLSTSNDTLDGKNMYGADQKLGGFGANLDAGGVVWGTERPELLITETLAWHDRRTTDESSPIETTSLTNDPPEKAAYTTDNSPGAVPDYDYDQLYRPRGAAFIELYNPNIANPAVNADTHLINGLQDLGVNIAAVDQVTGSTPVWRIAVYQRPFDPNAGIADPRSKFSKQLADREVHPNECASWDPDSPYLEEQPATLMDRCIYLAQMPDPIELQNINDNEKTGSQVVEYFSDLEVPTVRPGRYLVIGSGEEQDGNGNKQIGSNIFASEIGDLDPWKGGRERRRIELYPGEAEKENPIKYVEPENRKRNVELKGNERTFQDPDDKSRAICDVAIINRAVINGVSQPRRFTFTEPAGGYPGDPGVPAGERPDYYDDPNGEGRYGNIAQAAAFDWPYDDLRWGELFLRPSTSPVAQPGVNQVDDRRLQIPQRQSQENNYGILPCYSVVYLQRLSNPMLPFHKDTNPYRTVDAMSANVSVFNGTQGDQGKPSGEKIRRGYSSMNSLDIQSNRNLEYFASLQRGTAAKSFGAAANLYTYEPPSGDLTIDSPESLEQLGMILPNRSIYFGRHIPTGHTVDVIPDFSLGYVNHPLLADTSTSALSSREMIDRNDIDGLKPEEPFSWLTWNNRPFISSSEMMFVPSSRSSRLLQEFSSRLSSNSDPYDSNKVPYAASNGREVGLAQIPTTPAYLPQRQQGEFGQLQNFMLSEIPESQNNNQPRLPDVVAGLSRVLDYIHVPSRYVGTETWLNPSDFGRQIDSTTDARSNRQPPFNKISSYREPGRVNLNTIVDAAVWDGGLMHRELADDSAIWNPWSNNYVLIDSGNLSHAGPLFINTEADVTGLIENRRGYAVIDATTGMANPMAVNQMLALDPNTPTFFANPFRSSNAGYLVPLDQLRRDDVDCHMLRSNILPEITIQNTSTMNLEINPDTLNLDNSIPSQPKLPSEIKSKDKPFFFAEYKTPQNNATRNPYFRYQPMTRLDNLTTTRSHVFAVWVTIGFFEVEEAPTKADFANNNPGITGTELDELYSKVYPEGYMLGQESGSETGDLRRIREFAIIDRSIPVGFEPGKNHNVERAVRLRRRIE